MSKYDKLELGFGKGAGASDGKLLVLKPIAKDGVPFTADFDVTRNSSKYITNKEGLIVEVLPNYPSMESVNGGCPVFLMH